MILLMEGQRLYCRYGKLAETWNEFLDRLALFILEDIGVSMSLDVEQD